MAAQVKIGRYQILEELGRGAMGVVYKAHDPNLDIDLALKVLRKDRGSNDPFVRRFVAEARALGRLDHPEIIRVYNVDQEGDDVYIAMEFVTGTPLSVVLKERKFDAAALADFASRMARALEYAHNKGIIHRDIKPSNIIWMPQGRFKITDFGIARIEDPSRSEETQAGEILGTPAYMSPEQVLGQTVDGRSDLFSLGIILYEMAAGRRPFQGQGLNAIFNAITNADPAPLREVNPALPRPLADAIMACLNKSPDLRPPDGAALASLVAAAVAPPAPAAGPSPPQARSGTGKLVAAAGVCLMLAVLALLSWGRVGTGAAPKPAQQPSAVAKSATLRAESTPAGARVELDGSPLGVTPAAVPLSPGKHELVISLQGYHSWEGQVELEQNSETPVSVALTPAGL